jgi:hypothetical protein
MGDRRPIRGQSRDLVYDSDAPSGRPFAAVNSVRFWEGMSGGPVHPTSKGAQNKTAASGLPGRGGRILS